MSHRVEIKNGSTDGVDKERANRVSSQSGHITYGHHKRSKSASEKNFNLRKVGDPNCLRKDLNESSDPVATTNSCRASPIHSKLYCIKKNGISNHRASLEKDVQQLQLRLQQEKSMRLVLEKAMGRASSTLSPGHRHFAAQTKELIAEIELLEEEVANREQHVLALYRSIFEHCISHPVSENSSLVTSPAHAKSESRKHPSIISSAFCSSKKFPLGKLHSLSTVNDSGKKSQLQSKTRHVSPFNGKDNIYFKKTCTSCPKAPITSKTSVPRTLKDHIYQCPSKLAKEMVRCMASVYYWLRNPSSQAKEMTSSSNSSTSFILQQNVGLAKDWSTQSTIEIPWISTDKSNFSRASYAINHYSPKNRNLSFFSYNWRRMQFLSQVLTFIGLLYITILILVEQLEKVNASKMDLNAQIAFWINLYNSLIMHAYMAFGIPHNSLRRLALFHKAAYNVGGFVVSANTIEQSIFCYHTTRLGQWLETVLSTAMRKRSGDEKKLISSKFGLQSFQPLVCFALCTGAYSDPLLNVYTAANIKEELEAAKREFLQANIVIKKSKNILLPKLVEKYSKEASIPVDGVLEWVSENVDKKLQDSIQKCCNSRPSKRASQIIKWLPYNSTFRYVFSKDLTHKALRV